MKSLFSTLATAAAAAAWMFAATPAADAQNYPDRPITLYVGLAAGGGTDLLARALAAQMSTTLGQPVVVENLPGASGTIAGQKVVTAPKDGYSLILVTASEAVLPAVRNDLPYKLTEAFAPIDLISENAYLVCVTNSFKAQTLKEFIDIAKAAPGSLDYASAGAGSHAHIVTAALALAAGIQVEHVAFKGGSEASVAVAAGNVDMTLITPTAARPLIESGKLRALAITTAQRSPLYPNVPTVSEAGLPGFAYGTWYALLTTAGTPDAVVQKLNAAAQKAIETPQLAEFFAKNGMAKRGGTAQAAADFIKSEVASYGKVVKDAGIKLE